MFKSSIILNLVFTLFFLWYFCMHMGLEKYYRKYISPSEVFLDDVYYQSKVEAYSELNRQIVSDLECIVFVGDSLIVQFPIYEFYPTLNVLNRGIDYDTSLGILKRLENNLNNLRISNFFLMVGHNDLKYRSVNETFKNIQKIFFEVKAKNKFFLSILPTTNHVLNESIILLNHQIKEFCFKNGINYVDCYDLFIGKNGEILLQYFYDGTHLNLSGYRRIDNKIHELMMPTILPN